MRTIFDPATRKGLISRIELLTEAHQPLWGKMNVLQMIAHMNIWNEWVFGRNELPHNQGILGKLIGRWMLKKDTKDDTPMAKGMPAGKGFTTAAVNDGIEELTKKWVRQIYEYEDYTDQHFMHDFYGKMSREQLGVFAYKHMDHHLRQFDV